jgi:molecular chaperone DnaK (HSP70)
MQTGDLQIREDWFPKSGPHMNIGIGLARGSLHSKMPSRPSRAAFPKIEATFEIGANCILKCDGKRRPTTNRKITITSSSDPSKEEVETMTNDAESHAADDRKQAETIDAKNRA